MFGQFNTEDYGRDKEEQTVANREPETILKKENKQDVSTIWGSVPTVPEKFENAALFLRLCLPSTLIRHARTELFENALQTGVI